MSRTARFKSVERGGLTPIPPWGMENTEGTATRLRGPTREAKDVTKFETATSACRHQGGGGKSSSTWLFSGTARAPAMRLHGHE